MNIRLSSVSTFLLAGLFGVGLALAPMSGAEPREPVERDRVEREFTPEREESGESETAEREELESLGAMPAPAFSSPWVDASGRKLYGVARDRARHREHIRQQNERMERDRVEREEREVAERAERAERWVDASGRKLYGVARDRAKAAAEREAQAAAERVERDRPSPGEGWDTWVPMDPIL